MLSKLEPVIRFLDSESIVVTDNVTAYENAISNFNDVNAMAVNAMEHLKEAKLPA